MRIRDFRALAPLLAAGLAVCSFSAPTGQTKLTKKSAHAELLRQERLARREGIPLTEAEFARKPPVPDAKNAAPIYAKAGALLVKLNRSRSTGSAFDPYNVDTPQKLEAAQAHEKMMKPVMDLVAVAVRRRDCDLHQKFDLSGDFPELANFKAFAKLAVGRAALEAHDGHRVVALQRIQEFAPICGHLGQAHTMTSGLVQVAVDATYSRKIADVLTAHGRESGVAEAALRALAALGPPPDLVKMAEGEGLMQLGQLNPKNFSKANEPGGDSDVAADIKQLIAHAQRAGELDAWRATQVKITRALVASFRAKGDDWIGLEHRTSYYVDGLTKQKSDANLWIASIGIAPWPDAIDAFAVAVSRRRVLMQSAAILAEWAKNGRLPSKLPLAGVSAHDPLANAPYHYVVGSDGFKLYGVGRKGESHGGKLGTGNRFDFMNDDIGFSFPAAPAPVRQ